MSNHRNHRPNDSPKPLYDWPRVLLLGRAAVYTGRSKSTLRRAVADGALKRAGQCGKSWSFLREDLDAYLLGPSPTATATLPEHKPQKSTRRARSTSVGNDAAIARLRQLAKGGAR